MDTQQAGEPTLWPGGLSGRASDLSSLLVRPGGLVATFSFHQQQARHHSEGPGDRPAPTTSSQEHSTRCSYPGTCPMNVKTTPLAAEEDQSEHLNTTMSIYIV